MVMSSPRLAATVKPTLEEHDEISIGAVADFLRESAGAIMSAAGLLALATGIYLLVAPRWYTATAAFTPQSSTRQTTLAGLASQFGLTVPGADASRSPSFYGDLVVSREILGAIVDSTYRYLDGRDTVAGNLVTLLDVSGSTPASRREKAIEKLRKQVGSSVAQRTGVVSVSVKSRSADLSYQILRGLLSQVDHFNRSTRQTEAAAEQRFTEQRLAEVRAELLQAENTLQEFMQSNRSGAQNSPGLAFREQRLQREVALQQAVYTTLAQAFEQAKIEAVRDTPLITMVERPNLPARPDPRGTIRKLALAIVLGVVVGVGIGLFRAARRGSLQSAAGDRT